MYKLISDQYSQLFPPDEKRCDFVLNESSYYNSGPSKMTILDAGCATGDLAFELAASGCEVTGIDLDSDMIKIAKKKSAETLYKDFELHFFHKSMINLKGLGDFNTVVCFGNTLPHLSSNSDVKSFFQQTKTLLRPNGRLIFQIINFDRLGNSPVFDFPDIDAGTSIFKRSYSRRTDGRIDFKISLEDKQTGDIAGDSTALLPLKRDMLIAMMVAANFSDIKLYSDYEKKPADGTEFATLYSAWR